MLKVEQKIHVCLLYANTVWRDATITGDSQQKGYGLSLLLFSLGARGAR